MSICLKAPSCFAGCPIFTFISWHLCLNHCIKVIVEPKHSTPAQPRGSTGPADARVLLQSPVFLVPMVTVTSDHKLEGLKTAEIDFSQLRGLKSKMKVLAVQVPSESLEGKSVPGPLSW